MKKLLGFISLFLISTSVFAGTISFDQLATSSDLTVAKYNGDMSRVYQKVNTDIATDNVTDDTLLEADFADESNPRIRTYEGAACEKVYTGLLTTTTVGTLTGSVPTGTAYPRGFRCDKTSSTPKTFTASRWTFVDIDQSCNFQYSEVTIGAATPSVASNSIRISRVSTDSTKIADVQDLRTTSCTAGPFDILSDATNEANLDDLLSTGRPVRDRGTGGFVQGAALSWDTHTTFKVTAGSVYINGKFRRNSTDISVPQTTDSPSSGTSGIDSGAIAGSTRYNVFAVADQDSAKTFSVTFSSSSSPAGVTNARKISEIKTDGNALFTSRDMITTHGVSDREVFGAWANLDTTVPVIRNAFNVSGITDNGAGDITVAFDIDFNDAFYATSGFCYVNGSALFLNHDGTGAPTAGTLRSTCRAVGGSGTDATFMSVMAVGDNRK